MAIVQTQAQLRVMGAKVGIHPERCDQIKALQAGVTTVAQLQVVMGKLGFYKEQANHLVAAGVTFV